MLFIVSPNLVAKGSLVTKYNGFSLSHDLVRALDEKAF